MNGIADICHIPFEYMFDAIGRREVEEEEAKPSTDFAAVEQ